jgi:phthiocerol/phenolphthiocerol synthesis type-I polyketide synthase E
LTLRLLDARTPAHVVVRPFVDGRPEPLAATPSSPVEAAAPAPPAPVTTPQPVAEPAAGTAAETSAPPSPASGEDALSRMRAVWVEVLGAVDLEPDDDFFDVGGTSLSAIEVVSRIRAEFETELSIAALLEAPTIAALAKVVAPGASTS